MLVDYNILQGRDAVEHISAAKNDPSWVRERRLGAWELYESMPMPTGNEEEWRRTSLKDLRLEQIALFSSPRPRAESPAALAAGFGRLVSGDGTSGVVAQLGSEAVYSHLDPALAARGVVFTDMDSAVTKYPELVEPRFMTDCLPPTHDKFAALHAALWSGGAFLYVPAGVEVALPFQAHIRTDAQTPAVFPHTLIVAEPYSKLVYLEDFTSEAMPGRALASSVAEIYLGEGAQVRFASIQAWGEGFYNFSARRSIIGPNAVMEWVIGEMGAELSRSYLDGALVGRGGRSVLLAVFLGCETQHIDMRPVMTHVARDTSSDMMVKGALRNRARSVFRGLTDVKPGARGTVSFQREQALVLSKEARADAIPGLEISENDVRVGHAASMGRVDEDLLFYLMSRGLSEEQAKRIVVEGFFEPVLQRVPVEVVREELHGLIQQKIEAC